VREWNEDTVTNVDTGAPERVSRGGSWSYPASNFMVSSRFRHGPAHRNNNYFGLRLARLPAGEAPRVATPPKPTPVGPQPQVGNSLADPAFQRWLKGVAALPAEEQVAAVAEKLKERNPGFDGTLMGWEWKGPPKIEDGVVTLIGLNSDKVTDISPIRALAGLKVFGYIGGGPKSNSLSDLSPLQGLPLTSLYCMNTPLSDLSPLKGMPLTDLNCRGTKVADLTPLAACPNLRLLNVSDAKVTPAGVAALQKALPKCKITWNGAPPAKSGP
jgi:hypothetical protein